MPYRTGRWVGYMDDTGEVGKIPEDVQDESNQNDVLDIDQVRKAIHEIFGVFGGLDMTVTECIYAIRSVNSAFKGQYPELYGIIERDF